MQTAINLDAIETVVKVEEQKMNIDEAHYSCHTEKTTDIDHGPCTAYIVQEAGVVVYLYDEDPTRISIHPTE